MNVKIENALHRYLHLVQMNKMCKQDKCN